MKYEILGGNFPVVECRLDNGETMMTESGSMAWMSQNVEMATSTGGGLLKGIGRSLAGESLFLNYYTAKADGAMISFGSSFPGRILPMEFKGGQTLITQKRAFLAASDSINIEMHFRKKLGAGLFGGEGFILQKLSGNGTAFLEVDGELKEYTLGAGEKMVIDQGYLFAMESTVSFDIERVKGVKNVLFGGEGLFVGNLTGPGKVYLQTMPIANVVNTIMASMPAGKS